MEKIYLFSGYICVCIIDVVFLLMKAVYKRTKSLININCDEKIALFEITTFLTNINDNIFYKI